MKTCIPPPTSDTSLPRFRRTPLCAALEHLICRNLSEVSSYTNKVHFGYANIMPAPPVTANVGYNLTSTSGFTPTLADPTILTSLGFNCHKPTAELDVNLVKGLTWKTAWGYYDYNEKFSPAPLTARDFQANNATLSLRYEF